MKIDVHLSPAVETWPALRDGVLAAQDAGFDTAWTFDHFAGSMLRGTTMLECFTLLGALAAATDTIGLGSLVVNVNNRPAGVVASAAASVQAISGGRFTLGLGAGAAPGSRWSEEHRMLGIELGATIEDRHRRLHEALDTIGLIWSEDRPEELATFARPDPPPPIVLGVNSEALAVVAAQRCDGINVRADHPQLGRILRAASDARSVSAAEVPWDCSVWAMWDPALLDLSHPEVVRWVSLGVTRLVLVFLEPHDRTAISAAADAVRAMSA